MVLLATPERAATPSIVTAAYPPSSKICTAARSALSCASALRTRPPTRRGRSAGDVPAADSDSVWFPYLRKTLEARGHQVHIPNLPDSTAPRLASWGAALRDCVANAEPRDTVLVGHTSAASTYFASCSGTTSTPPAPSPTRSSWRLPRTCRSDMKPSRSSSPSRSTGPGYAGAPSDTGYSPPWTTRSFSRDRSTTSKTSSPDWKQPLSSLPPALTTERPRTTTSTCPKLSDSSWTAYRQAREPPQVQRRQPAAHRQPQPHRNPGGTGLSPAPPAIPSAPSWLPAPTLPSTGSPCRPGSPFSSPHRGHHAVGPPSSPAPRSAPLARALIYRSRRSARSDIPACRTLTDKTDRGGAGPGSGGGQGRRGAGVGRLFLATGRADAQTRRSAVSLCVYRRLTVGL